MRLKKTFLSSLLCLVLLSSVVDAQDMCTLKHPKTRIHTSHLEILGSLIESHVNVFGYYPSSERLAMAYAQVGLETGQGAVLWNNNIGNVDPNNGDVTQEYYIHNTHGRHRRSFETLSEGCEAYWIVVSRPGCNALKTFDAGNPTVTAHVLKRCHYYSADEEPYAVTMRDLYARALVLEVLYDQWEKEQTYVESKSCY